MKTINRLYLVLAVLLGVGGCVEMIRLHRLAGTAIAVELVALLPGVAFFIAYLVTQTNAKRAVHLFAISLCAVAMAFSVFVIACLEMFLREIAEVTDPARYEEILVEHWRDSDRLLVSHFPRPIPENARNVAFSFRPAFLQGGAHVQLRCSLPADVVLELYQRFSRVKTKSFFGGYSGDHINMKEGMPTTDFHTSGSSDRKFPKDFEVMIFDKILKKEDRPDEFYWNHGRSHGVAISKQRNEIVYWAEHW